MRPTLFLPCLTVLVFALSLPTQAAEWSAEPTIILKTSYNDNIRLTTTTHDPIWDTKLSPSVAFGVAKPNQGLSGNAGFSVQRFSGGSGSESNDALNREDYHLRTNAYFRTQRNTFRGNINYTIASTLDAELDETGNVASTRATRNRLTLGPSWNMSLSEQLNLSLRYQLTDITLSDGPGSSTLVESSSNTFSSSLVRQFTPRIQGTLSASISSFEPETGSASNTINMQAGISRNFSETLSASFLAGLRETTSDIFTTSGFCIGASPGSGGTLQSCLNNGGSWFPTGSAKGELKNSGAVFSTSITKTLEAGSISASLSRSSSPSGDGEVLDTTRLILSGNHSFTESLSSSLTIEYNEREIIVNRTGQATPGTKTLLRVRPEITWRWSRKWRLQGHYEYMQNTDVLSPTATRNTLFLTLSYKPTKISLSR